MSHNHLNIFNLDYSYRVLTHDLYPEDKSHYKVVWDVFALGNEHMLSQYFAYENFWRETILLKYLDNPKLTQVKKFGQMPNKVIYREIQERQGITLGEYIDDRLGLRIKESQIPIARQPVGPEPSQKTVFTEFEAIELTLKIIDLVEILHDKDILHTNLAPENILL